MKSPKKSIVCLSVLLILIAIYFMFRETSGGVQSIPIQDGVQIISISRIKKNDETVSNYSVSGDEIEDDLSVALLDCLCNYSMTVHPISAHENMYMTESYDHISLWLQRADSSTFRINISSEKNYSNVEYDGRYFGIKDSVHLLQEVGALLDNKT